MFDAIGLDGCLGFVDAGFDLLCLGWLELFFYFAQRNPRD